MNQSPARRIVSCFLMLLPPTVSAAIAAAEPPDLTVALGERNAGRGLVVPSAGDGVNRAETVAGEPARRIAGDRSLYMYVAINDPAYERGPIDAYVVVEAFDDRIGRVSVQYDKAADQPDNQSKYTNSSESMILTGTGAWRRGVFHLPGLRLGHGQNQGADFRIVAPSVAIRRVSVSTKPPDGHDPNQPIDAEALKAIAVFRPPGMELTLGNDASPADAAVYKALSVTSVESYVTWADVEPKENEWDWSKWDRQVEILQNAGLKWVPFLIAGPAYATPDWFANGPESHVYRCLDHDRDSKVQSLWNPKLRPRIERFLAAFAERYGDSDVIESVLLGATGIYGESIYPAGPEGGWTADRVGRYHNHMGWWAADPLAEAAFREALSARHGSIDKLNAAWGSSFGSFDDVKTFHPDKAPSDQARADLVEWYQQAMTDWSVFWVEATRKAFPKTPIYLCTGGDGNPMLGADFTAQAAAIAPAGAGIRITNEGSDYADNFVVTREVATATRHYGTFCGIEPASKVDEKGVVARIYNATASGARQLHDYAPNMLGPGVPIEALANFRANAHFLVPRNPKPIAALYLSRETWALDPTAIHRTYDLAKTFRDAADIDFVTRRSVIDGHLKDHRLLVLVESPALDPKAAEAIESWVREGGTLLALSRSDEPLGSRLHDNGAWRSRLFSPAKPAGELVRPVLDGDAPERWRLDVGGEDDQPWLFGDWFHRERTRGDRPDGDSTTRWTGARPTVFIPLAPKVPHTLRLRAQVPNDALGPEGIDVLVDGRSVGRISEPGERTIDFRLHPREADSGGVARLSLHVTTWKPSEREPGNTDPRSLGIFVRNIEVFREGAENAPARDAAFHLELDASRLKPLTKTVGEGRTVLLTDPEPAPTSIGLVFASLLPEPVVDGRIDGRYATATDSGVLWYDARTSRIWESPW